MTTIGHDFGSIRTNLMLLATVFGETWPAATNWLDLHNVYDFPLLSLLEGV